MVKPVALRHRKRKIIIVLIIAIVLVVPISLFVFKMIQQNVGVDPDHLPQFVKAQFIDLSKIVSISKYRSSEGHDFSDGVETCRSMKHYFAPAITGNQKTGNVQDKIAGIKLDGKTDIPIYSPVDGTVTEIASEHTPIGSQIHITPDDAPQFDVRIFHVWVSSDIKGGFAGLVGGTHVKAGQQIGVIAANQDTDISVEYGNKLSRRYVSLFEVMDDNTFAAYQAWGLKERSDAIISKEYRDAHPLQCANNADESFVLPANYDATDQSVYARGYIPPSKNNDGNGSSDFCSAAKQNGQLPPGCQ